MEQPYQSFTPETANPGRIRKQKTHTSQTMTDNLIDEAIDPNMDELNTSLNNQQKNSEP